MGPVAVSAAVISSGSSPVLAASSESVGSRPSVCSRRVRAVRMPCARSLMLRLTLTAPSSRRKRRISPEIFGTAYVEKHVPFCRCGVPSLGAPEQVARLLGDHARRRMRRHIVTVVPRPGTDLTRSVSMKLSMIVKPMPLRSSPPVVYSGVRACATSAMPMP